MGNHLGPFKEAIDWPEHKELVKQGVQAVGGQVALDGVTQSLIKVQTFFLNPFVLSMGNHMGPFPEPSD